MTLGNFGGLENVHEGPGFNENPMDNVRGKILLNILDGLPYVFVEKDSGVRRFQSMIVP